MIIVINFLEEVEQQFHFTYPQIYKQLCIDGMLDWGEFGPNWRETYWEKFKANPPLLLFGYDIELIPLENIKEYTEEMKHEEDFWYLNPKFEFIPFAKSSGGDMYVFQLDKQVGEDVPIISVSHEDTTATVLAKNLQDFIFRKMLEQVTEIFETDEITKEILANSLRTHSPYLTKEQVVVIEDIYQRDFQMTEEFGETLRYLLTEEEWHHLLKQHIDFNRLGEEFEYSDVV